MVGIQYIRLGFLTISTSFDEMAAAVHSQLSLGRKHPWSTHWSGNWTRITVWVWNQDSESQVAYLPLSLPPSCLSILVSLPVPVGLPHGRGHQRAFRQLAAGRKQGL